MRAQRITDLFAKVCIIVDIVQVNVACNLALSPREPTAAVVATRGRLIVPAQSENAFDVIIAADGSVA